MVIVLVASAASAAAAAAAAADDNHLEADAYRLIGNVRVLTVTASLFFQPEYRCPQADYAGDAAAKAAAAAGMAVQTQAHMAPHCQGLFVVSTAAGDESLRGFCRNRL